MVFKQGNIWEMKRAILILFTNLKIISPQKVTKKVVLRKVLKALDSQTWETGTSLRFCPAPQSQSSRQCSGLNCRCQEEIDWREAPTSLASTRAVVLLLVSNIVWMNACLEDSIWTNFSAVVAKDDSNKTHVQIQFPPCNSDTTIVWETETKDCDTCKMPPLGDSKARVWTRFSKFLFHRVSVPSTAQISPLKGYKLRDLKWEL